MTTNLQETRDSEQVMQLKYFSQTGNSLGTELLKHLFGQMNVCRSVVLAFLTGLQICLIGPPGTGKTHVAETMGKILGFNPNLFPLHPEVTGNQITGKMVLDFETRKPVYWPSPFLGGKQMIILDELNRTSDRAQNALLEILRNQRVIMDGRVYSLPSSFTTIMTMNPPEAGGTRPIISALADRIDYTIDFDSDVLSDKVRTIQYHCLGGFSAHYQQPSIVDQDNKDWGEERIFFSRLYFNKLLKSLVSEEVIRTAALIVEEFEGEDWEIPATNATGISMVKMAAAEAFLRTGIPMSDDVWRVAPGCLGMIKPKSSATQGSLTTPEIRQMILQHLKQLHGKLKPKKLI